MCHPFYSDSNPILEEVLSAYTFPSAVSSVVRYGQGHINDTFCVTCKCDQGVETRYLLQRISSNVFPDAEALMENFEALTSFLRRKIGEQGGDPNRETLSLIYTNQGRSFHRDSQGEVWRLVPFIENTECFQNATPELFEASARAFGRFQFLLTDYPAATLHETISKFHDTEDRFRKFMNAVEADAVGRVASVQTEIDFVLQRKADCSVALDALRQGILPLRVTHNDTKLNNLLMDRDTGEGICVIDLDTTMPGLSINDFGDSIRFGANHCAEDEKDLNKVNFDLDLYEVYVRGFLKGANGSLTQAELEYLPWGARLMTLECGIRFLTDYLEGDHYFHIQYPEQNLDRSHTQFKLVHDMEQQFAAMCEIVQKYAK